MILQNKKIVASILFVFISFVCFAQTAESSPPQPQAMGVPPPPGTPIDGALPVLFLLALIFGIYKSFKRAK